MIKPSFVIYERILSYREKKFNIYNRRNGSTAESEVRKWWKMKLKRS